MKKVRTFLNLLHYNGKILFVFELVYKLIGVAAAIPLLFGAFDLMMHVSGYQYLTMENLKKFIRQPLLYAFVLLAFFAVAVYTFVDFSAVIYIIHCSKMKRKTHLVDVLRYVFQNTRQVLQKQNHRLLLWTLLLLLYSCIGQIPEIAVSLSAPNVLMMASRKLRRRVRYLMLLMLLGVFPYMRRIFCLHFFSLENAKGKEALQKSRDLSREGKKLNFLLLFLIQAGLYLSYVLLMAVGIFLLVLFGKIFAKARLASSLSMSLAQVVITVLLVLFSLLGVPVNGIVYSVLYYYYKEKRGESLPQMDEICRQKHCIIDEKHAAWRRKHKKKLRAATAIVIVVTSAICIFYVYQMNAGEWNRNVEYLKTMEVTAHRGASHDYPENTMAAFRGAIENGADWIELDIRESKDKQLFVMHDRSFFRTTGTEAFAWELTYEEISQLDAGSLFDSEFAGERIPLLSEVIDLAKENNVRLNIEIKPSSYEQDMEEILVELLQEKDFVDRCVVTSQTYESIKEVKLLDEEIKTVYVMSLAYGNINRLKYADAFSVRASSISNALVSRVHNKGKQIYAWTVNSRDTINLMISRQVDNIITDDVPLAKKCIGSRMNSSIVNNYIGLLNRQIRFGNFLFR